MTEPATLPPQVSLIETSNPPILCIYHANCADGFTAAWSVWKAHPEAEFVEGFYGKEPPDCTGRNVIMVDFSYKRPVLLKMAEQANSILILDHHKSAESELADLPSNVTAIFDMARSGAMMAWQYFHPNIDPSQLIRHVQDRDLWRFELEYTKAFQANLFSLEYTFENWERVNDICGNFAHYTDFVKQGDAINRKHLKDVKELIKACASRANIAGYDVPVLNAPYFYSSEAGHIMCNGEPFAVCYWNDAENRIFSLRSNEQGEDVSIIAQKCGGGGHRNAAGFSIPLNDIVGTVI